MGRPAQAPAYLAPHVVDDGDEQQHTAHGEQDVLRVAHHPGQQHQLGVEHLKGLALHGPSLRTEGDKQAGATRRCHSMPRPCVPPPPPAPAPSQAHWPKRALEPGQSGKRRDVVVGAPFPPGPHKETTFPRLPCSWARPYDHILANGMWAQGCYNFTPGHENRPHNSLHHFSRPLKRWILRASRRGGLPARRSPPKWLCGAEHCLSPAPIRL